MSPRAFVLMPFDPTFNEIYNLFIASTLADAGYEVLRADDIVSQRNILRDILAGITESDLIIADLTGSNPNVYYELGLAHALQKSTILLTQSVDDLPFDLRSYRVVSYDTHFAAIDSARERLRQLARAAAAGEALFSSPVSDFLGAPLPARSPVEVHSVLPAPDQGEPGFIDNLVALEDGFAGMTRIVEHIGQSTGTISEEMNATTRQIDEANASNPPNVSKYLQHLLSELGRKQGAFADDLEASNDTFSDSLQATANSLERVITFRKPSTPKERESLQGLADSLAQMESSAAEGMSSMQNLAEIMVALPRIVRTLGQATQRASIQVRRFVNYTGQVLSMASRAQLLALRMLNEDNQDGAAA